MSTAQKKDAEPMLYKGKPLVREGNTLCYGNTGDRYVLILTVLSEKNENNLNIATKVFIQIQDNNPEIKSQDRVVKQGVKDSLYEALDTGEAWLSQTLAKG